MSFSVVWEFIVPEGNRDAFERAYSSNGPWVDLFREADGFLSTWLLRDKEHRGKYLSHDRWTSREAFEKFKRNFAERYEDLDEELGGLATRETYVGSYDEIDV
jgi:heme-degrading monooxygenase HmoA